MDRTEKLEAYNRLCERLMEDGNESYVPDGTVLSLAVYSLVEGRCADAYFLYATDYETFSEPYARISLAAETSEILLYESTEEHPFQARIQVPEGFYGEEEYIAYVEAYMDIRGFVFSQELDQGQRELVKACLEAFRQVIRDHFEACYLEMGADFIKWAESV